MVHIVVSVLAVASDAVEAAYAVEEVAYVWHLGVGAMVCRICFGYTDAYAVADDGVCIDDTYPLQFVDGHIYGFIIRHCP